MIGSWRKKSVGGDRAGETNVDNVRASETSVGASETSVGGDRAGETSVDGVRAGVMSVGGVRASETSVSGAGQVKRASVGQGRGDERPKQFFRISDCFPVQSMLSEIVERSAV